MPLSLHETLSNASAASAAEAFSLSERAQERAALIAVNTLPGIGSEKVRTLRRLFGSLTALKDLSAEALAQKCGDFSARQLAEVVQVITSARAEQEERRAKASNVTLITLDDDAYPETLRAIPSAPLCLYCAGNTALLKQSQIAIIGTRAASLYGKEQAQRFAMRLAASGLHVTSGLAHGIDSAAHEGALLAGETAPGKTIAVLGAALDTIYPTDQKPLAVRIVRNGGLVVSEYPFGRHADKKTFPQRNRIVAALCDGVFVVETAAKGGTLITASYAQQFNKALYALPGRVDVHSFGGNLDLLRSGDARLVRCPEDILEAYDTFAFCRETDTSAAPNALPRGLTPEETTVYQALGNDECSADELALQTGLDCATIGVALVGLRFKRCVIDRPGGRIKRR